MVRKGIILLGIVSCLWGCSKVPVTGRKQVSLLPESQLMSMSITSYKEFLSKQPAEPATNKDAQMVRRVGSKIAKACEDYLKQKGLSKRVANFNWEFNLVNDKTINAWCMPGGKVVVYTGILDVAGGEPGLAVVMGHEIAHAIARHGNERMSQQLLVQAGGIGLSVALSQKPQMTQDLFLMSYGLGSQLGSLKYSRLHETEADKMGLIFMSMAGYDPKEAISFWQRMSNAGGAKPPELLSTHPHDDTRINDIKEYLPVAMKYYKKP